MELAVIIHFPGFGAYILIWANNWNCQRAQMHLEIMSKNSNKRSTIVERQNRSSIWFSIQWAPEIAILHLFDVSLYLSIRILI